MTNADKFKSIFGLYATELWAKPEKDFLEWLNADAELFGISEQLENEKDHFANPGNMVGDLISRQAAIDEIKALYEWHDMPTEERMIQHFKALPSAQQEIVACGDCIHWIYHDRRCGYWNHGAKPLDWCCNADRRTDE